ncbi:MAG: hypothetical protein DRP15_00030 [Candidatus Aenigmatarchaeota archaeon]|nr:MAG: hypothetical protein DRP15_00030 [Candidatus Aenigmarchaeota archaeon]
MKTLWNISPPQLHNYPEPNSKYEDGEHCGNEDAKESRPYRAGLQTILAEIIVAEVNCVDAKTREKV